MVNTGKKGCLGRKNGLNLERAGQVFLNLIQYRDYSCEKIWLPAISNIRLWYREATLQGRLQGRPGSWRPFQNSFPGVTYPLEDQAY